MYLNSWKKEECYGPHGKQVKSRNIKAHAKNRNHTYAIINLEDEYGFKRRIPVIEAIQENLPPRVRHFISTENVFRLAVEHIQHNVAFRLWQSKLKTSSL
jgi:hypothetical protein